MERFIAGNVEFKTQEGLDYYRSLQKLDNEGVKEEWLKVTDGIKEALSCENPVKKDRTSSSGVVFN